MRTAHRLAQPVQLVEALLVLIVRLATSLTHRLVWLVTFFAKPVMHREIRLVSLALRELSQFPPRPFVSPSALTTLSTIILLLPLALSVIQLVNLVVGLPKPTAMPVLLASTNSTTLHRLLLFTVYLLARLLPISNPQTSVVSACSIAKPVPQVLVAICVSLLTTSITGSVLVHVKLASSLTH